MWGGGGNREPWVLQHRAGVPAADDSSLRTPSWRPSSLPTVGRGPSTEVCRRCVSLWDERTDVGRVLCLPLLCGTEAVLCTWVSDAQKLG